VGRSSLAVALGLLVLSTLGAWLALRSCSEEEVEGPKHVVLIVIDTLRADIVREVDTPVFDGLVAEGETASRAWSSGTWTAPSVISMFSGMPIRSHGWDFPFPSQMDNRTRSYAQVPEVPLIAEVLKSSGFQTSAFYGNHLLSQGLGYDRGFDRFQPSGDRRLPERVATLLESQDLDERQFLYLHLFGGHQPLRPTSESAEKYGLDRQLIKGKGFRLRRAAQGNPAVQNQYGLAYRAVVEDIDKRLGELMKALAPIREDSLIIITSDHGEMLGEHGHFGHFEWLYEPLTTVPFVVVGGPEIPDAFSLSAIPDLITTTVGVDADWPVRFRDQGPLVSQREGKLAFSEEGRIKAVWDSDEFESGFAAFDLEEDPMEQNPLEGFRADLEISRDSWLESTPHELLMPVDASMTDSMLEALEELGYMD
jgi:hypothetical protein